MPAKSKAQSKALNAKFGHAWVKKHHYDNPTGGLPEHVGKKAKPKDKPRAKPKKKAKGRGK
jgi:hypothetical protein